MDKNETKKTQIREADNTVRIEGILRELNLKEENDIISGDVIISIDSVSDHSISVYVAKLTKDQKENKAFKGMKTVMNEYVSIADLVKDGKTMEEAVALATKVRVNNAKLGRNEFYLNDELVSRPRITSNFLNRIDDNSFEPKAEFTIECYFEKIRKETKESEETGRLFINVIIPMYGGQVVPMEFVATDEVAEYIEANYETKKTGWLCGDIINIAERVVSRKAGFGQVKDDVKVNYTRELLVTGGGEEQYDPDNEKAYTTDQIQEAWKTRETETLPALLKKAKDKDNKSGDKNNKAPGFKF